MSVADFLNDLLETRPCRYGLLSYFKSDLVIGRSLREYGEWAQKEVDFLVDFIRPGDTVVDVGAFIGTHTLAFAHHVGDAGLVYAYEPNPLAYKVLEVNVQQNNLSNVRLFNVGLAAKKRVFYISEFAPGLVDNPGAFSLVMREINKQKDSVHGTAVELVPLDEFELQECRLIKIDAEGMEVEVIEGAHGLLERLRPLVYAECLSIENGARLIAIMREKGYEAFMHCVSAYNPDNFRKNDRNFFGKAQETNIFFSPNEDISSLCVRSKKFRDLIPVSTLDDLALVLLRKPQYKHEVLAGTKAANIIGNEFWANELELDQLRAQLEQFQVELSDAQAQIEAEREKRQNLEQELQRLYQRLDWKRYRIVDRLAGIYWRIRHPRQSKGNV